MLKGLTEGASLLKPPFSWLVCEAGDHVGRAAAFIDGGYLDKVALPHGRVDFRALAKAIVQDAELLRAYYYHCLPYKGPAPSEAESAAFAKKQEFFKVLDRLPRFQVREGRLERRGVDAKGRDVFEQKRVDVMLAVDMVEAVSTGKADTVVLLAGDSDFVPAVEAVKRMGALVVLWHAEIVKGRPGRFIMSCGTLATSGSR
jgi:uncharacterized LabA/DUF88 family protein